MFEVFKPVVVHRGPPPRKQRRVGKESHDPRDETARVEQSYILPQVKDEQAQMQTGSGRECWVFSRLDMEERKRGDTPGSVSAVRPPAH